MMGPMGLVARKPPDASVSRALAYPGTLLREPTVLGSVGGDTVWRDVEAGGRAAGVDLRRRVPVVALGSNGSVATLGAKLAAAGVSGVVPLFPAVVAGVAVAHSAHVSLGGYVAATPLDAAGGAARAVLAWFDHAQLEAMDASEPNYVRHCVSGGRYPLSVRGGPTPRRFWVYRSLWGVLALDGHALRLRPQRTLHADLAADRALATRVPLSDPVAAVTRLRTRPVRLWVRTHWARTGRARRDGLDLQG